MKLSIIFEPRLVDGGNAPNELIYVEINDDKGNSINAGDWISDGEHEVFVIDCDKFVSRPASPDYKHGESYVYDATSQTFDPVHGATKLNVGEYIDAHTDD